MKYKDADGRSAARILRRLADMVSKEEPATREMFADDLNAFLDELASQDFFGTEGQLDPRGDKR